MVIILQDNHIDECALTRIELEIHFFGAQTFNDTLVKSPQQVTDLFQSRVRSLSIINICVVYIDFRHCQGVCDCVVFISESMSFFKQIFSSHISTNFVMTDIFL